MRNGLASDTGPLDDTVLWETGPFTRSPRQGASDGNVYVVARIFSSSDLLHGTYLYALDVLTGAELWHIDLPVDFPDTDYRVQLIGINGGRVYATRSTNTYGSYLYALSVTDGSIVWRSEEIVSICGTEGAAFAPNGDLVVGNLYSIRRIKGIDGTTVWDTFRVSPSSDGSSVAIFGDRCYCWQSTGMTGPVVRATNLTDGSHLYDGPPTSSGLAQQIGLFTGHDGTIYAPRAHNNPEDDFLIAYTDTGSEFVEKWQSELGFVPFSTFAVGPDGSVYSYDRDNHIVRIDPDNGSILNTSDPVVGTMSSFLRAAVDPTGILYITVADWPEGMLYSFNPDLTLRWSETYSQIGTSGPVLADGGILIIAGDGTEMVAYCTDTGLKEENATGDRDVGNTLTLCIANPVMSSARIIIGGNSEHANLQIFDLSGRCISSPWSGVLNQTETVNLDIPEFASGVYLVKLSACSEVTTGNLIVVR